MGVVERTRWNWEKLLIPGARPAVPWVTLAVVFFSALVSVAFRVLDPMPGNFLVFHLVMFVPGGAEHPFSWFQDWPWQFITSFVLTPFCHADVDHFILNIAGLLLVGPWVERTMGRRKYAVLLATAAYSALLFSATWVMIQGKFATIMGISAAVYAAFGAFVVVPTLARSWLRTLIASGIAVAVGMEVYEYAYLPSGGIETIEILSHIAGFGVGAAVALRMGTAVRKNKGGAFLQVVKSIWRSTTANLFETTVPWATVGVTAVTLLVTVAYYILDSQPITRTNVFHIFYVVFAMPFGRDWHISSAFLTHFCYPNILHLSVSMAALWIVGASLEKQIGWRKYVCLLATGLVVAAPATVGALLAQGGIEGVTGFSGAIYAAGAASILTPAYDRRRMNGAIACLVILFGVEVHLYKMGLVLGHAAGFSAGIAVALLCVSGRDGTLGSSQSVQRPVLVEPLTQEELS